MATLKEIVFYDEEKDTKTPFCIYIRVSFFCLKIR